MDIDAKDEDGTAVLHVAAILDHDEVAEFLIQKGANVDAKGGDGGTTLHVVACLGRSRIAKLLIENGADIEVKNNQGAMALDSLKEDWGTTQFIAPITTDQSGPEKGRGGTHRSGQTIALMKCYKNLLFP